MPAGFHFALRRTVTALSHYVPGAVVSLRLHFRVDIGTDRCPPVYTIESFGVIVAMKPRSCRSEDKRVEIEPLSCCAFKIKN